MTIVRKINLPRDFSGPVAFFEWSLSSRLILVASVDQIHVFSVLENDFHATIRSPVPPASRPVFIGFGPTDSQVCVCATLGLRFAVFDLVSSKAVEIANTKSYTTPASTCRGFCFRPGTQHLTILTRMSGKDTISIHHPVTKEVQRSWFPDTIDAQGLVWSSDGRWLVTWEAAAHGHRVLFYTSDGNLFKAWSGPQPLVPADADINLGPGVKVVEFSADARLLAIGDSSRRICILDMTSVTEALQLQHPGSIAPTDALQVRDILAVYRHTSSPLIVTKSSRSGKNKSAAQVTISYELCRPSTPRMGKLRAILPNPVVLLWLSMRHRHSLLRNSTMRQARSGYGIQRPPNSGQSCYSMEIS